MALGNGYAFKHPILREIRVHKMTICIQWPFLYACLYFNFYLFIYIIGYNKIKTSTRGPQISPSGENTLTIVLVVALAITHLFYRLLGAS